MKIQVAFLLLFFVKISWSQSLEERIERVENGLTIQATMPIGEEFFGSNIIQRLKENKAYGASVAIVHDGKIEWSKAYGVKQKGSSDLVTTETLFQCASIGKVITAVAILNLVKDGKISLDEDINSKLQRWQIKENEFTKSQKVTVRHLLSHTAGLTDDYGFLGYDPKDKIPSLLQILNNDPIANTKKEIIVKTTPGQVERYSGAGYLILQLLVEDVSGASFSSFVEQRIFTPLQMTHSTYDNEPDKNLKVPIASGHLSKGKALKNKSYNIYPEKAAAGPWTTAEDLAKLIIAIQEALHNESSAILDKSTAEELTTVQLNNKGLGINLKGVEKAEAFWHAGQNLGYTGLLYGLVDEGDGAVILLNTDGGERLMQEFITSVAHEYNWPVMKSFESLDIPKEVRSSLVGKFESHDKSKTLFIAEQKGGLVLKPAGSKRGVELVRIDDLEYTFKDAQDYYRLTFNIENSVTTLRYIESVGNILELKKVK
ncbi:serine hydrolase domain-containing protein [Roseivirga sp.]|uniref:serine hydrolase domain-containing protein n=1 Tax=Roseivirga sp. TaxID=1964215 RepID=UPI003B8B9515